MFLDLPPLNKNGVLLKLLNNTIHICGSIDNRYPTSNMTFFFDELHNKIVENEIKEINVDVKKLDFLNSSGIKEFVMWIMKISEEDENNKYKINFVCNDEVPWQRISLTRLENINSDIVKVV